MPLDANDAWYPKSFQKQVDVLNSRARALLVSGPRLSGKTRAVLNRVARHLWETDRARVGMFARTMKSSKDGGSWTLMVKSILPEWFKSGIGMRFTSEVKGVYGPKTDGLTRTPFFRVNNMHGTESEMLLFSLDNDDDVEAKLKELELSMVYFSELDKFGDRRVLTVALPSLRMGHLKFEDQMWIADCNPSEEGDASWIYQVFLRERLMSYEEYSLSQKERGLPVLEEKDFRDFYSQLDVIEILPRDNIFVDPRQLQEVKVACGSDLGLYARHVEGKWVWGGGDASRHFRSIFKEFKHVVGDCSSKEEDDWIIACPTPNCFELLTGWDLGDVNHACLFAEKTYVNGRACFTILDELISVGQELGNEDFTESAMETLASLEEHAKRKFNLDRAWSDRNTLEKYSATGDTYPYLEVLAASSNRFFLRGVGKEAKAKGSVRQRVNLVKQLLAHDRLKVSAHCKLTIKMFKDLKKGSSGADFVVSNEDKHAFDALSYMLFMECAEELETMPGANGEGQRTIVVSV